MSPGSQQTARVLSVVAATVTALACGTNYAYSAWAPEFGDRLGLSSTQENLIGTFGNLGTYSLGIPLGVVVDSRGARPGTILAAILLGVGYFSLFKAYKSGPDALSMPWLCLFSYLTGVGSCSGFMGAVKTSAVNWPDHRGTATAFPLAAYGLSAFFFTLLSQTAFPDDTTGLLLLFTIVTVSMVVGGGLFLRAIPPNQGYSAVPNHTELNNSTSSTFGEPAKPTDDRSHSREPGTQSERSSLDDVLSKDAVPPKENDVADLGSAETSSLLSRSSASDPEHISHRSTNLNDAEDDSRKLDVRGLPLLTKIKFWQIWISMGLLTGIGLMTINNIGSDARAMWHHYDDSVPAELIQERQLMHVEILSFASFCGRLSSGVGSDIIVSRLHLSRFWMLLLSSLVFLLGQIAAISITIPQQLVLVSSLNGFAYGVLFGVGPALVVEAFGIRGLSQNWGIMTLAPILFGNIFNLVYGGVYDSHSTVVGGKDRHRSCDGGVECYRSAYLVTMAASVVGVVLSLWSIRHDYLGKLKRAKRERERDERREA